MKTEQLELAFDLKPADTAPLRRRTPRTVVRWWFDRIHRTVTEAIAQRQEATRQRQQELLDRVTRDRHNRGLATRPPLALARQG